ncbi:MAG: CHAT domain-containing protein [Chloroflexota bacterium]
MSIQTNHSNQTKPVIFLAFANPTPGTQGFLRNLGEEARQLETIIRQAHLDNLCELVIKPYAGLTEIVEVFHEYRDRIAIFHYAGHAENFMLLLEDSGGGTNAATGENRGTTMIDGRGLATFLGEQNSLQLVFLNACSTQPQVEELLNADVPAVIATSQSIHDDVATMLATHFYQSLTSGANLQKAFNEAEGLTRAMVGKNNIGNSSLRDAYFEDGAGVAMTEFYHWPWRLTINPGAEQINEWSLADAANEPLFGLPPLPEYDLPDKPFRHLNFFTELDAEIFFGRGHYIRTLYDLVTTPNSAPIILFYGESGVGKSSMLAAGLLPRLQHQTIHYVQRDQGLGLTGTLAQVLWDGESMPATLDAETLDAETLDAETLDAEIIANRWHEREQIAASIKPASIKPLIIVLDQVEEIFTRPNPDQPDELSDFLDVLSALFTHRSRRPQGKLVLGFRKEWLADIEDAISARRLPRIKLFLSRLTQAGIAEAVTGVSRSTRLQTHYRLSVESGLAEIIANDLLEDPDSPIAPTLQILLTKMWTEAEKINPHHPHFDIALYQSLKREGLLLRDFLVQQLEKIHEWRAEVVESGLALDVLATHTTPQGTVDHHTEAELLTLYRHVARDIPPLIQKCEDLYLLFNPGDPQSEQPKSSRLVHDALAVLTRHHYEESDSPGQRARRILDSRVVEWVDEQGQMIEGNPLDEGDLGLVEAGLNGTRHLTPLEQRLLETSRVAQRQREQDRKRQRQIRRGLTLLLAVAAVVAFFLWRQSTQQTELAEERRVIAEEQTELAQEQTALAEDRRVVAEEQTELAEEQTELAEERRITAEAQNLASQSQIALLVDNEQGDLPLILARDAVLTNLNSSSSSALRLAVETHPQQRAFPAVNRRHAGGVRSVVYSPDGQTIASSGDDGTIRLWSADDLTPIALLFGHTNTVNSIFYSPDGTHIVSGSEDRTVRIWDVDSGEQVAQFEGHSGPIRSVAYHPDGQQVASGSNDKTVILWDVTNGAQVAQFAGHIDWIQSVAYRPDGTQIASGSDDKTVILWDIASKEQVAQIDGHTGWVYAVSYSPDGRYLASAADDKTVRIWDVDSKEQVALFEGHPDWLRTVAYSPDGTQLVSGDHSAAVLVWDIASGKQVAQFDGHTEEVYAVAYSPDGRHIVSSGKDTTVQIWDADSGEVAAHFPGHSGSVSAASYRPDGAYFVSGGADATVRIWDATSGEQVAQLTGHSAWVRSVSYSPDGKTIVSGSDDGTVRLWDAASGEQVRQFDEHTGSVHSVSYSPDEAHIVSGGDDNTVRIWEFGSGEQIAQFDGHTAAVSSVAYSPNGQTIVSGSQDNTVRIWDVASGEQLAQFDGHSEGVNAVSYSRNGKTIVSGSQDNSVRIWAVASGEQVGQFDGHSGQVNGVSFSPDGAHIVSGGEDNTMRIWDVASGQQVAQFNAHAGGVNAVSYSPDGQFILSSSVDNTLRISAVAPENQVMPFNEHLTGGYALAYRADGRYIVAGGRGNTVHIWDMTSGEQVMQLDGHTDNVATVAYSPDGAYVASGGDDRMIRIWHTAGGEQVMQLEGHTDYIEAIAYSPDGTHIASGSDDRTVRIWDVTSGMQVAQFEGHSEGVNIVVYSPDGSYIASGSGDDTAVIWEVASGKAVARFDGHIAAVRSVAYSPDGRFLVTGSHDQTIKVWSVDDQKQVAQFTGHTDRVTSVFYSPDGMHIASASEDKTVRVWHVASGTEVAQFDGRSGEAYAVAYRPDGLKIASKHEGGIHEWEIPQLSLLKTVNRISRPAPILTNGERQRFGIEDSVQLSDSKTLTPLMMEAQGYGLVEEGSALARRGDIAQATQKFKEVRNLIAPLEQDALILGDVFDFEPTQEAIDVAVSFMVHEGNQLARAGHIMSATHKFEQATALDPTLALDPETNAKHINALVHRGEGRRLARTGAVGRATQQLETAMALDPSLAIDPAAEARRLAGFALLEQVWTSENDASRDNTSKARELLGELTEWIPAVTVGRPVSTTTGPLKYWHFMGREGQLVTIEPVNIREDLVQINFGVEISLVAPNGTPIGNSVVTREERVLLQDVVLPETGPYFVLVKGGGIDVDYGFTVSIR